MALTPKQKLFVQEYLVDLNATQAAARAGYKDPNIGRQLITKNNISDAIQKAMQDRERRTEITQDMVIRECARLAFFDVRKMFNKNGKPLDISNLDDDTAAALVGLDVQDVMDGDGDFAGYVKKYKMADKLKALELLGRHVGAFERNSPSSDTAALDSFLKAVRPTKEEVEALYAKEDE